MANFNKILLGVRALQALLSVVVLGLMAYGSSPSPTPPTHPPIPN